MESPRTGARRVGPLVIASLAAKPIGFLKEMLVAAFYGSGVPRDAFLIAWQIPNLIGSVLQDGLPQMMVIFVADVRAKANGAQILGGLLGLLTVTFLLVGVLLHFAADPLVGLVAPFVNVETHELAVHMLRILAFGATLAGVGAALTGLLFAREKFIAAALAIPVTNLVIIAVIIFGHERMGIQALVWGTVAGLAAAMLFLSHGVIGVARPPLQTFYREHREFVWLLSSFFAGSVLFGASAWVEKIFASTLPPGSISELDYAFRIFQVFIALLAIIPTFLFPRLCAHAVEEGGEGAFQSLVGKGVHALLLLALPAAGIVWALREPLVEVAFQRGAFTAEAAGHTAALLGMYALGLAPHALNNFLAHVFYARKQMRVRVQYACVYLATLTLGNVLLVPHLGAVAIALANTLAAYVSTAFLLMLLWKRADTPVAGLAPLVAKSLLSAVALAGAALFLHQVTPGPTVVRLAVSVAVSGIGFLVLARLLRIEGAAYLWDLVRMVRGR